MSLFSEVLSDIENKSELKAQGKSMGVPYPYPRFARYVPSIDREQVICLTSFSGAAKSKFARYTYIMHPYEYSLEHDYNFEADYYAFEDSAAKVFKNILCYYLHYKHKESVSLFDLDSKFHALPSATLRHIKEGEVYLQKFADKVRIKDNITNPYGIYKDVLARAEELGEIQREKVTYSNGEVKDRISGLKLKKDVHWLMLADNLNNIDKEKQHHNQKEAMDEFVQRYCRLIYAKLFKMTCVIVHQQALEAERQQFTNTGGSIIERIKPSMANLGGTKEVVRSYHLVLSLFNPHKFKIKDYNGYDISRIGNNFREIEVLKYNDGFDNIRTPLYFDGASEFFKELPNSDKQKEELLTFYNWLDTERYKKQNKLLF